MYPTASASVIAAMGYVLAIGTVPDAHTAWTVDPCSLLTTAQVSSAIRATAQAGKPINTTGCAWTSTSPAVMVTISFDNLSTFAKLKAASSPVVVKTPISGVGDDAFYNSMGAMTTLTVKKGTTYFVMRVYGVTDQAKQKEIEKTLATEAAARM